jgi:hypothetical protein
MEKVLKRSSVKDGIRDGTAAVDDKLAGLLCGNSLKVRATARRRYLGGSHSGRENFVRRPGSTVYDSGRESILYVTW